MSRYRRGVFAAVTVVPLVWLTTAISPVSAAGRGVDVLLEGLSSPKGLAVGADEDLIVAQGAFGPPAPVLAYQRASGTTRELTEPTNLVDVATNPGGNGWGLAVGGLLFFRASNGEVSVVLDMNEYQAGDPDPDDQDGDATISNPYSLAGLSNGDVLVADAQNNDLVRVSQDGSAVTVARFQPEEVSTDHIPNFPDPSVLAEAVPTGIAVSRDGWVYVSELKGFPFRPGSSNVWRVNPNAVDAVCSPTVPNADCAVYRTGFTALVDIAVDDRNRKLYTYSLGAGGVVPFEEGFATGEFPPAVLTEVRINGTTREIGAGQLSQPGGVVVTREGKVYVTDHVFTDGRLLRVRA
jgi:hypothetical protein